MHEPNTENNRHCRSGFGTASLILGIMSFVGACLVAFLVVFTGTPRLIPGLGLCGGGVLAITGLALGIAGVVQSQSKAASVVGIILNTLFISIGVVLLLVIALQTAMVP